MTESKQFDESQFLDSTEEGYYDNEGRDSEDYMEEINEGFYDSDSDDSIQSPGRSITKMSNKKARNLVNQQALINSVDDDKYDVSVGERSIAGIMMIFNQRKFTKKLTPDYSKSSGF